MAGSSLGSGVVLGGGGSGIGGGTYTSSWGYAWPTPTAKPAPVSPPPPPPVIPVTPTFDPKIEANALYGKAMALSALGFARIGASPAPIVGPYINSGTVDFVVSFGVPANPDGTRVIYAIYLDNEIAWQSASGGTLPGHGTFLSEAFDFVFKPGRLDQTVCSLETAHFPGDENAYRPQMLLQITGLPYARFMQNTGKPVPYVACDIGDTTAGADPDDGLNLGEALERIAHCPWAGYTSDTFEAVNITDIVPAILLKERINVIDLCQNVTQVYRNLMLLQSDKLRIKDNGSNVTPSILFDLDTIVGGTDPVTISRAAPSEQPREYELLKIDPDQDYTIVGSLSKRPRDPVAVSSAVDRKTITIPIVMDAELGQAMITFAHYYDENARKRIEFSTTFFGYEVEPGDLVSPTDIGDGVDDEIWRVTETSHNGDFTVGITAEAILRCGITYSPSMAYVAHYEDGSQVSTYTFGSANIGVAADDRIIVVAARVMRSQSIGRDIVSVTLGGVAMTQIEHLVAGDGSPSANAAVTQGLYYMAVASGTTATIVVNSAGNAAGAAIDIYRLTGLGAATPFDSMSTSLTGGTPSGTIDIPFNGILIATWAGVGSPGSASWTGINTVNVNEQMDGSVVGNWWGSSGSQSGMTAQTGRTISVTDAASGYENLMAVSFG